MYLKYKDQYPFINNKLQWSIIDLFKSMEKIHSLNKTNYDSKKKFLNYWFILYKIFEWLNLHEKYKNMLD